MSFTSHQPSPVTPYGQVVLAKAHTIVIIDSDNTRAQKVARLLTLAGLRAIVEPNSYQAFERFLQERFQPKALLVGQQEELYSPFFARFTQRMIQELRHETPVISYAHQQFIDGNLLVANPAASTTAHTLNKFNSAFLEQIYRVVPQARISLEPAKPTMALDTLPKLGLEPRVSHVRRSTALHFHDQLKAAKTLLPAAQWESLLKDVGLGQFVKEENWPSRTNQHIIPPEYLTCLNRAIMFSEPTRPVQQAITWSNMVEADILLNSMLVFLMQQVPKIIGKHNAMNTMLGTFANEIKIVRGEDLVATKRLENNSFVFVMYSNLFAYGFMGATQPSCFVWQAAFDRMLEITKLQAKWTISEVECSSQTHTGHCVFLISPNNA